MNGSKHIRRKLAQAKIVILLRQDYCGYACRLILRGAYCGVAVSVGRIMPPSSTSLKSIFGLTAKQHAQELHGAGVATNKGRPRRASASRGRTREKSSPLLESQVRPPTNSDSISSITRFCTCVTCVQLAITFDKMASYCSSVNLS